VGPIVDFNNNDNNDDDDDDDDNNNNNNNNNALCCQSSHCDLPPAKYEVHLKSSRTGYSSPLLCRERSKNITVAHCRQSTNFSNGPRSCSAILKRALLKRP
jgi:hypothetical protein